MNPAAIRRLFLAPLVFVLGAAEAAETAPRGAPSRPGVSLPRIADAPLPTRKFNGLTYVSVADLAARLELKLTWLERGRKLSLATAAGRTEIERDTRDIVVNGLRVFLGDPVVDSGEQLHVSRIDAERCLTPLLRPGHGIGVRSVPKVVVLDPGHGGRDNGTSANEKVYALDVARRAKKMLEGSGFRVALTRDADEFLDLPLRAAVANAQRADLFASIHFNALPNDRKTSGVEIFTFAPQFQRSTNSWSVRGTDDTERDAAPVNRHDHWSVVLAQAIQRRFVVDLKAFDRGKKLAHWGVLRALNCPGVLVECGFLTSEAEARKIGTAEYRQKLAEAVAGGIRDYAAAVENAGRKI